jgi:outer membrane protein, multidrug efflux system
VTFVSLALRPCAVAAAIAALCAGCAAPRHASPTLQVDDAPAAWQRRGGEAPLRDRWWRAFDDPVLERHVERALARNTDLRVAIARVAEARAESAAEHGAELPRVDLEVGEVRSRSISPVTLRPYLATDRQATVQVAWELDLFGRLAALSAASDASLAASADLRDATALAVASQTASAYLNLRALDERLAIARRTLEARRSALVLARSLSEIGQTSALERVQAEAEYRSTAQAIPQLQLAIERQAQALAILLGDMPGEIERGAELLSLTAPTLPDLGIPSRLLRRRPDIAAAEAQVAASDARLDAARAELLPSVRLAASLGRVGSSIFRDGPFSVWSVGGSVLAPLFNGGQLKAEVDAAAARRDQAIAGYRKTVITAFGEVENQLAAIEHLQEQAEQAQAQRVALAEALRIARNRFREGYSSYLDELDAQRNLFAAEQTVAQLRADWLTAHVDLYRALGGGWDDVR